MVVLIIAMGTITYSMAEKIIVENYQKTTEANLNVLSRYFSGYIADIKSQTLDIVADKKLWDYAFGDMTEDTAIRSFKNNMYSRLQTLIFSREGIDRITIICKDNVGFTVNNTGSHTFIPLSMAEKYYETEESMHYDEVSAYGEWNSSHETFDELFGFEDDYSMSFVRNITAYRSKVGMLLLDISDSFIINTLLESNLPDRTSLSYITADGGETCIAKDAETIRVSDTDLFDFLKETDSSGGYRFVSVKGSEYILIFSFIEETRDVLTALIPIDIVYEQTAVVRLVSTLIILGAVSITLIIGLGISHSFGKTIKLTRDVVKKAAEGDIHVRFDESTADEFSIISRDFNKILDSFVEAGERARIAEIRSLEAQINPHFLYNTLDAINFVALEAGDEDAGRMLTDLADILRYSINNSNTTVLISDEVEYLRKYIHLQQMRFKYSFSCVLDVDPEAMNVYIHKLILQPLIENSIVHAFVGRTEDNQIEVHIIRDERNIHISVSDNGIGIPKTLIDEINTFSGYEDGKGNIGIRNVLARLKMYYGNKCRVFANADENGTVYSIDIEDIADENINS